MTLLKIKNISVKYGRKLALQNIELELNSNEIVTIVGPNGSGKTTLFKAIIGTAGLSKGSIEKASNLKIGYVPQQIYLADTTVSENIAFGLEAKEINHENVERAAKIANLHEFILNELPLKYETTIGERGVRLSGGQRQRIGIARALYNEPKLLIFDEATSALDNTTEKSVMEAIYSEDYKTTKILIAHRLSTVKKCDKIFLFDKGELKHEGNYQDLLKNSEKFRLSVKNS